MGYLLTLHVDESCAGHEDPIDCEFALQVQSFMEAHGGDWRLTVAVMKFGRLNSLFIQPPP